MTDDNGALLPYSRYVLEAAAFYHGDLDSIEAVKALLALEYKRWLRSEGEKYMPSEPARELLIAMSTRTVSVHVAGLVGLSLLALIFTDKKPAITKAYQMAAAYGQPRQNVPSLSYARPRKKMDFYSWDYDKQKFVTEKRSMATSARAVRKAFRDYKSVIHICAARISSVEYLLPLSPFEPAPEADACMFETVALFERLLSKYDKFQRDNRSHPLGILNIDWGIKSVLSGVPLLPSDELLFQLLDAQDSSE